MAVIYTLYIYFSVNISINTRIIGGSSLLFDILDKELLQKRGRKDKNVSFFDFFFEKICANVLNIYLCREI